MGTTHASNVRSRPKYFQPVEAAPLASTGMLSEGPNWSISFSLEGSELDPVDASCCRVGTNDGDALPNAFVILMGEAVWSLRLGKGDGCGTVGALVGRIVGVPMDEAVGAVVSDATGLTVGVPASGGKDPVN